MRHERNYERGSGSGRYGAAKERQRDLKSVKEDYQRGVARGDGLFKEGQAGRR